MKIVSTRPVWLVRDGGDVMRGGEGGVAETLISSLVHVDGIIDRFDNELWIEGSRMILEQ